MIEDILPNAMKIGNRTVTVRAGDTTMDEDGNRAMGWYDFERFEIVIDETLKTRTQVIETFWHEIVHAINDYNRFHFEIAKELDDEDSPEVDAFHLDERLAESFAKTFLQVMQDNAEVLWLTTSE